MAHTGDVHFGGDLFTVMMRADFRCSDNDDGLNHEAQARGGDEQARGRVVPSESECSRMD